MEERLPIYDFCGICGKEKPRKEECCSEGRNGKKMDEVERVAREVYFTAEVRKRRMEGGFLGNIDCAKWMCCGDNSKAAIYLTPEIGLLTVTRSENYRENGMARWAIHLNNDCLVSLWECLFAKNLEDAQGYALEILVKRVQTLTEMLTRMIENAT